MKWWTSSEHPSYSMQTFRRTTFLDSSKKHSNDSISKITVYILSLVVKHTNDWFGIGCRFN